MKTRDFLFINHNNTRTKFALADSEDFIEHRAVDTEELSADHVRKALSGWEFQDVVIASVVPPSLGALTEALESIDGARRVLHVTHEIELGVKIDFPRPESVGADRLANAAAVASDSSVAGRPVVVVDFGTAVTFDIVDTRPAYVGGVIAPGLDAMTRYLHQRAALLPAIEIKEPTKAIGKSTGHAMRSGAFHGYRGLVKEILAQIENELGRDAEVIATGGYADLISKNLSVIDKIDPFLTMKGLQRIAKLNFS